MDWYPLWNSLRIAAVSCVIVFFVGIFAAYYVAKLPRWLKGILDVLFTLPMVLPPTVCGYFLLLLFGVKRPMGVFLSHFGVQIVMTWYGGILASAVVAFPLMYRTARELLKVLMRHWLMQGRPLVCLIPIFSGRYGCQLAVREFWQERFWLLQGPWGNMELPVCSLDIFRERQLLFPQRYISSGEPMMKQELLYGLW